MDWLAFAGSILGGLIGGLFTFIGVRLTLKHEKEKERRAALQKANDTKPRLEIVTYRGFDETVNDKTIINDCNVLALPINLHSDKNGNMLFYDNVLLDDENLVFVEYVLKNTGGTEVSWIDITGTKPKTFCVFEYEERKNSIRENELNYDVCVKKRFIKPGDTITLRIYYVKNHELNFPPISAFFAIWLWDINGRIWRQPLFAPWNETDVPELSSRKMFHDITNVKVALDSFRTP